MRFFLSVVLVSMLYATPAFPEVYNWTDGGGTVHFTDDRAAIPAKYRKKAVSLGGSDEAANPGSGTKAASTPPDMNNVGTSVEKPVKKTKPSDKSQTELDLLASSLLQNAVSDRDKAFAAFSWIHANIYYDNASKWQRRYGQQGADQSPAGVLKAKKGVCEGLAKLFSALVNKMDLQSEVVVGTASGRRQERHAWNAVLVDGKWGLVDLTRGSFLNPPQDFLAHHFPDDPKWQLSDNPLTYAEWLKR